MDKTRVIERSLRCYVFGWLSLIPVLGIPMLIFALTLYQQVRMESGREWNPGGRYAACGLALACFGGLLSIGLVGILLVKMVGD